MTLERRLAKLEAKKGGGKAGTSVIFRCHAMSREPFTAIIPGKGRFARHDGESSERFTQRIASELA